MESRPDACGGRKMEAAWILCVAISLTFVTAHEEPPGQSGVEIAEDLLVSREKQWLLTLVQQRGVVATPLTVYSRSL